MECPICYYNKSKRISVRTQEKNKGCEVAFICEKCKTIYLEDYKKGRSYIYEDPNYSPWGKLEEIWEEDVAESKREAFKYQLSLLTKYISPKGKKLLDIGTGKGYLLDVAEDLEFDVYGIEPSPYACRVCEEKFPTKIVCGLLEDAKYRDGEFDVIAMTDVIEHISSPHFFFDEVSRILKNSGLLLIITPNSGSFTRFFLGKNWFQYKYEHIIYYNKDSLSYLLSTKKIDVLEVKNNIKRFRLKYYYHYFKHYSFMGIEKVFAFLFPYLPNFIKKKPFSNPITGEMIIIAQKRS